MDIDLPCPLSPLQHQVKDDALAVKLSRGLVLTGAAIGDGAGLNLLGQLPTVNF